MEYLSKVTYFVRRKKTNYYIINVKKSETKGYVVDMH